MSEDLNENQKNALDYLKGNYSFDNVHGLPLNESTYLRYLKARNFNVDKSKKLLDNTIIWRDSFGLADIHTSWMPIIANENSTGKMFVRGYDKHGHAIIYMRPKHENTSNHDGNLKHLVYNMERAIACMNYKTKQEKVTLLIDYDGFSLLNSPPMKTSRETLSILQDHYPERLHKAYLINSPWIFNAIFSALSPFIDPVTKAKIVFVSNKSFLENDFDLNAIEKEIGGLNEVPFNST
eukprot:gene18047-23689_t